MFKRFHAHIEGTGIGLYMIKKMIENAGGRIEVETEVGVGSTFII
jgi:two-component system, sensor histidine kinase